MKVSMALKEPRSKVEKALIVAIKPLLNKHLRAVARRVQSKVRAAFKRAFLRSEIYRSLTSGELWHEFGLVDPYSKLSAILEFLLESIIVSPTEFKGVRGLGGFTGGLRLTLLNLDFSNLYSLDASIQETEKGDILAWLNWLLENGATTIIRDYKYKAIESNASRSGLGLMVQRGRWSVPMWAQGTKNNNWLTRIFTEIQDEIELIIEYEVSK
jgi:hypothetical protein